MTTSGSVDFSVSRDNLISDALTIVGGLDVGGTVASAQTTLASRMLNMIVKAWNSHGIQLWARATGYVLPFTGASSTTLGAAGSYATASYVQTTLSTSATDGATTIEVTSATGMADTYFIGIEMDDDTMHWTTINGAPSGTTVTLTAAIDDDAAAGNYVYCFQTRLQRPVKVIDAYVRNLETSTVWPINVVPFQIFHGVGGTAQEGVPVQVNYDPQLDNGVLYVYPRFLGGRHILELTYQRPLQDFDATGDTPDMPQEAYDALMLALAVRLAPIYGMPAQDRTLLKIEAKEALELLKANEPEEGSFYVIPDLD